MNVLPALPAPSLIKVALLLMLGVALVPPRPHCVRYTDTKEVIKNVECALVYFQTDNTDSCPASLGTLVEQKFLSRVPVDTWGQPLWFACPGRHNPDGADIVSAGPDHIFGTRDDIRSWEL